MFETAGFGRSAKHVVLPFHHRAHLDPGQPLPAGVAFPVVHDTLHGGPKKEEEEDGRASAPTVPAAAEAESRRSIASHYVIRLAVGTRWNFIFMFCG